MNIKIIIKDRNYTDWYFVNIDDNKEISKDTYHILSKLNPLEHKLFSRDIIKIVENETFNIVHSYIKSSNTFAGVLVLEGNKTYGRTSNKKRLLYKCIPDDKHLPVFLIPYEVKIGFLKLQKNKYVVFKFDNWNGKHPYGILSETLGDIDSLEVFYEYQLYCKSLHISINDFTNKTKKNLNEKNNDEYINQIFKNSNYNIEDRREQYIFTIDPNNSSDFDDGFSIQSIQLNNKQYWKVTIYIANVFFWLETLDLWNSFSKRVSTIYLPDKRRPMLPTILSDMLCSLEQKQKRFALAMDFYIDELGQLHDEIPIQYRNVLICVSKNYVYEDYSMINNDKYYKNLFDITMKMDGSIRNSHDLVSHWMIFMNKHAGVLMSNDKIGIFRAASFLNVDLRNDVLSNYNLNDDTKRVIRSWNNTSGQYILYSDDANLSHDLMFINKKNNSNGDRNMNSYIHITSPIRRLVDLLNQMILLKHYSLINTMSPSANEFLAYWISQLDYINSSMRAIRKIQTDCELITRCFYNPEIMDSIYKGVIFDKVQKNNGTFSYMVFLEEIKLLSRITSKIDIENYSRQDFKLFLFEDEDKLKKKIRLQIV
jgi:exoribonuclease R